MKAAPHLSALSSGAILWMLFQSGPGAEESHAAFLVGAVVAVATLAASFRAGAIVGAGFVAGPLALAWSTASRGDGSLWVLVFPMLVILGGWLGVVGAISTAASRAIGARMGRAGWSLPGRAATGAAVSLAVLAVVVAAVQWPRTFAALDQALAEVRPPDEWKLVATLRSGDPLCSRACSAHTTRVYAAEGDLDECLVAEQVTRQWVGEPAFQTGCTFAGFVEGGPTGRLRAEVSGRPRTYAVDPVELLVSVEVVRRP